MKNNINKIKTFINEHKTEISILAIFLIAVVGSLYQVKLWVEKDIFDDYANVGRQQSTVKGVVETSETKSGATQRNYILKNQNDELNKILVRKSEILKELNSLLLLPDSSVKQNYVNQLMLENDRLSERVKEIENEQ